MKRLRLLMRILVWKLRALRKREPFKTLTNREDSIDDFFSGDGFAAVFLNPFQKKLVYRHLLVQGGLRRKIKLKAFKTDKRTRAELGAVNETVLNHIAKLYENTLRGSEMVLAERHPVDGFLAESLELERRIYIEDKGAFARRVAYNLRGRRVLILSRAAYLIKTQYDHLDELNPGLTKDFRLLALNPYSEIMHSASGQFFAAYDELKVMLLKLDFDVVLFDDSLYALPLAGFAASLGKKAILLGTALWELFGIAETKGELQGRSKLWTSLDVYSDDIAPDFLATGQLPEIK